ncbi:PAS domain-containing hybrid sensor histidine kinase/response regulator [Alteromonas lipotrueiana]|uniref:PAS domain-containing hybrid sensor histidine kinase/response regulator n=1 Tax=Alteromonas lipotrueiana TaxID=2803815 RepID=UPI001C439A5D|nr:ATP-binding protein [Alteromonas lipotrueiana]
MFVNTDTLFTNAPCGLVVCETKGTITQANDTFCKWLGYSQTELIRQCSIQSLFTIGSRFYHHTHWAPLLQLQGSVSEVLIELSHRQGHTVPMLVNAIRHKTDTMSYDYLAFFIAADRKSYEQELVKARNSVEKSLSNLRQTQEQLKENQTFLSVAIRSARMGIWTHERATNQIQVSQELLQLTGLTSSEDVKYPDQFIQLLHPKDASEFEQTIQRAISHHTEFEVEFRLKHTSGKWLSMEGRGHAIYDENGTCITVFGVFIDISERKKAEKALASANQQLAATDRKKDEFLATLGHELRNPLAPIRNVLEIMHRHIEQHSELKWYHDILDRHVSQVTHIVDDLLEVTRISQGRLELRKCAVDVNETAKTAIESTRLFIEESQHTLQVSLPEQPVILEADPTRMTQILVNLLTNAAKYTPPGGTITLSIFEDTDSAIIRVTDTGIGIPQEKLSTIFNMFSQLTPALERAQGGLGIGLALVHGLVEMHQGSIKAKSEGIDLGSEFEVRLPVTQTQPTDKPSEQIPTPDSDLIPKKILIIDDNVDAAESLGFLLEFDGHTIECANCGLDGLKVAEDFRPEVVLSDIGLPDINGYEVAKRLRERDWAASIYLVAITGWGQKKDKLLAQEAGFDQHFTKPVDFSELKAVLREIE